MGARDRRRARAIAKAQRDRKQRNVVKRAVDLLVRSSEPREGLVTMRVVPGETVRVGDPIYASDQYPGQATTKQQAGFELGVAVVSIATAVTVRLHHRG